MKTIILKFTIGILLVWVPYGVQAATGKQALGSWKKVEIPESVQNLQNDLARMGPLEQNLDKSWNDMETKLLGAAGQQSVSNDIGMNLGILKGYQAEALNEIGALQDHWRLLAPAEKSLAEQARLDLERDRYAGP